ncbi:MAG TPA: hypothetical protein VJR27_02910 [Candidatus Saccharimonadales bacterium]|nr:hypothetical protein [Candidatus Saccharimonadales bacterium]
MTNYENSAQALEDRRVVDEAIAGLETQLQLQTEGAWRGTWEQTGRFIEGLYQQYAPEVSEQGRLIGQLLGATGLTNVILRYGADEHHPKLYSGSYEKRVLATFHHGGHSSQFIENCFLYASKVNELRPGTYDEGAFTRFPIIGGNHDLIIGNGRGNDEHQSAMLSSEMVMRVGFSLNPDEPTFEGTLATLWDEKRERQSVDPSRPCVEYQVASAVADFLPIFDRRGVYQALCCIVEDMTKKLQGQILTNEADVAGFSLVGAGVEDCLEFIEDVEVLRAKYKEQLARQVRLFRDFRPADPELDQLFTGRPENIGLLDDLNTAFAAGRISARKTLLIARDFMNWA